MKCYIQYKDSGIQWLGEIPSHWEIVPLYSVASYNDESWDESTPKETVINYVEISDVTLENGIKNVSHVEFGSAPSRARRKTRIGDIIISTVRTYLRAVAPITADGITVSTGFAVLRPQKVNSKYLMYYTVSSGFIADVIGNSKGTSYPAINASELVHLKIAFPPLPEQQAIASYLDTATAKIDEAIAQQQKMIDLLNERKQIIINNAVTKGLNPNAKMKPSGIDWIGNIPEHWDTIRIKYLLNEIKDRSATGQEEPLSMSQKYGLIPTKEMDVIPNMASSFVGAKRVGQGDLVFNKLKAHLGVFATSDYEGLVSPDYAVYKGTGLANLKYLEYIFKTPKCIAEFVRLITGVGSGLSRLYTSDLYSIYVPLPSMQEQLMIVEYIDSSTANIKTTITNAEKQITLLQERKQIIINDVVTGKVKVV